MNITLKHIGNYGNSASKIIEFNVDCGSVGISQEVTNFDGTIDESLIQQLESIVSDLKQQNELIKNS